MKLLEIKDVHKVYACNELGGGGGGWYDQNLISLYDQFYITITIHIRKKRFYYIKIFDTI